MELAKKLPTHILHYGVIPGLTLKERAEVVDNVPSYLQFLVDNPGCLAETFKCVHEIAESGNVRLLELRALPSCERDCGAKAVESCIIQGNLDMFDLLIKKKIYSLREAADIARETLSPEGYGNFIALCMKLNPQ